MFVGIVTREINRKTGATIDSNMHIPMPDVSKISVKDERNSNAIILDTNIIFNIRINRLA